VVKIKGRGGRRHIGGVVVRGSLKGLKTQTLSGRLVKRLQFFLSQSLMPLILELSLSVPAHVWSDVEIRFG
jgi:hypothetical protein